MNYDSENIQAHAAKIKRIIADRSDRDLIVFPELILHGHPSYEKPEGFLYRKMKIAYGSISRDLYDFVRRADARVIIGELKRHGERYYNAATYIDRSGRQQYIKTHVHWTENFTPGRNLTAFETPWGPTGVNICFDSAFSEVWRSLALKGAEVIVNISAVPATFPSENMWRRMSGAAVFNQVFVVYANRPGKYFSGGSAVFGPRGEIVAQAGSTETIMETEIDLDEAAGWREEEVLFENRRPLLYRGLVRQNIEPGRALGRSVELLKEA